MRYFEKIKQGGLLDLVLNTLIIMVTGKGFFSHGIEQFGIEGGRIVYLFGLSDKIRIRMAVIGKIRSHPQGYNIFTVFKPCFKGDDFFNGYHNGQTAS
jgi:hypothetical protein